MANEDKPDTEASAEPKEPKVLDTASEEQPAAKHDAAHEDKAEAAVAAQHDATAAAHDDHGLAHLMPVWLLVTVLAALMALTVLTVSVTSYDLGSEGNLVVGMVIATIKAGLVITFFMHLLWDKKFHLILFLTAVLFVVLFLSMSITDRGEYQPNIDLYLNTTSAVSK
ncbi:MAG TPA: cytochrome C oxidase subunit IV family protein [Polyangiaceae bacterium]|jgi:cytochrome c oxidase subunit 4|nr:cytochrome C oxidase subunit IV family protein [Polyangiaceae bacterium]